MDARRHLCLIVILLAGALAACSGSGSSGFDAFPNEAAAIHQALAEQRCVTTAADGFMICAADTGPATLPPSPTPTATAVLTATAGVRTPTLAPQATVSATATPTARATPTATATPQPQVDTGVGDRTAIGCAQAAPDAACHFTLPFAPQGFPPDAVFRVAVRPDMRGHWTISTAPINSGTPQAPNFDAPVAVDVRLSNAPDSAVTAQLAVLVFLKPPPTIPTEVATLADSGADFAFVTPELTVQPQPVIP